MISVGLTGGIGSGKSFVAKIFESLNVPVYYADQRAKAMYGEESVQAKITQAFGDEAIKNNGPNRGYLAKMVFGNAENLQKLNAILHPAVAKDFKVWKSKLHAPYCLREAAILFESGAYKQSDKVIVVWADLEKRYHRIMQRDGLSKDEINQRLSRQFNDKERVARADYLIFNNDEQPILDQVLSIHEDLIRTSNSRG